MTPEEAKDLIDHIINETDYELTPWEDGFIDSILKRDWTLSWKQAECLQKIYAKAIDGGEYQDHERI